MSIAKIFPTIENLQPYEAPINTPYFDVYATDSPYTVKSHGFSVGWFVFDTFSTEPSFTSGNQIFHSNLPLLKYYSGKSWPIFVSPEFHNKQQFGFIAKGHFQAQSTFSSLQFYGRGYVTVNYRKAGATYNLIASQQLGITKTERLSAMMTGLTVDNFYKMEIKHWSSPKENNTDFLFVGSHKDDTILSRVPLSAGYVVSEADFTNYSGFITATKLDNIESISLTNSRNESSKFSFIIPIVSTTASVGYKYVKNNFYFEDVNNSGKRIQRFRMVEFFSGFKVGSTISTITRFVGQIKDWKIQRDLKGKNVAVIECHDWSSFLLDQINGGIPNITDYLSHGYVDAVEGAIEGHVKPRAYDGWNFVEAIESLLINGNIDPKILFNKKKRINVDGNIQDGVFTVHDYNLDPKIRLDRPLHYGNPLAVGKNVDDNYNWQFSVSDSILDNVQQLMDTYGFRYGFNNEGNFYTQSIKNPVKVKSIDEVTQSVGAWTESIDVKKLFAVSLETTTFSNQITATFIGAHCRVIFDVGPGFGDALIVVENPTLGQVFSDNAILDHPTERSFLEGIDDSVGVNPCIFRAGRNLDYGSYTITVTSISGDKVSVNAFLIYDHDYETPDFKLYSGATLGQRPVIISGIDFESKSSNIRNDVIVVGRLKGIKSQLSIDPDNAIEEQNRIVNPNNPVSEHIISRAIDRISLGSVSNSNYVGRPLQLLIVEPKIATQERANWLAIQTAKRFNKFDKSLTPEFTIAVNPLISVEDYVKVWDIKLNTLATTDHSFWVKSIQETHNITGHKTQVSLESFEPWESFFRYPSPSLKRMGYTVFANVKTYNTGIHSFRDDEYCKLKGIATFSAPGGVNTIQVSYYKEYAENEALDSPKIERIFAEQGYLKIKTEIIKYSKRTRIAGPQFVSGHLEPWTISQIDFGGLTRAMYNTSTMTLGTLTSKEKLIDLSVSPYGQEDFGVVPAIEFDLLYPGHIQVTVKSNQGLILDSLTGNEVPNFNNNWDFYEPGKYFFSWGMIDRIGQHNEANSWIAGLEGGSLDVPGVLYSDLIAGVDPLSRQGPFWDKYSIGQGFYAHNEFKKLFSTHNFHVRYVDVTKTNFTTEDSVKNTRPIYLALRKEGTGVLLTDRPHESIFLKQLSQDEAVISSDVGTIWWNETRHEDLKTRNLGLKNLYKSFYKGNENNGLGFRIKIKDEEIKSRVCKLEVTRYILTFGQKYYSEWVIRSSGGHYTSAKTFILQIDTLTDPLIEHNTFNYVINGGDGLDIFIRPPSVGFFTPGVIGYINNVLGQGIDKGGVFYKDKVYSISICHLHLFRIRAIDFSGIRSEWKRSFLWVPNEIHNTEADFDIGVTKKNPYDNNPYEAALFHSRGHGGEKVYFTLPFNEKDTFAPHALEFKNEDGKLQIVDTILLGINVFGRYDG